MSGETKPRVRVLANGWIRHDGGPRPAWLVQDRVRIRCRGHDASWCQGLPAAVYSWRWQLSPYPGDIIAWRPA